MDLALFDLDETLICEDSSGLWLRWLVSQGFAPAEILEKERAMMTDYYAGNLAMDAYMALTLAPLAGMSVATVDGWIRRFIQRDILSRIYPAARERLNWHLSRGDNILVISASGEHLVAPIAHRLGAHGALAIGVETAEQRYTGNIYGTLTYKEGKVIRLQQWLSQQAPERPFQHLWAYSDSINDLPLLEHADYPVVVNPNPQLSKLAQDRGWQISLWGRYAKTQAVAG
ncbi:hydrolase [Erwinia sp. OLTSP20]|uniref:HAD family hydrolase n=1 Tax=unclassified Erwinia TaxID=2622719 RepID=UPI000C1998F7|nr:MULTISPECIES: HAD family hydrolase [unclassified Erwinia]PIJ51274.1 hydrolase [Erwinia sp. OAMSP11]PIJ74060.1 hydrolase [Erwinia sp. OLSSP12]PIJ81166.1 hydrolase [Erwinia sp. OLCASP19]PIJ86023.1 hydrolase [Erwinia sp. OLMTSP26]PIJ87772.1 hydrolase [Erwinia sp. OLMDSP33]